MRHGCWPLQTNRDGTSVPSAICLATAWLDFGSVRHTWSTLLGPSNFILINQSSELYYKKRPHSKESAAMWHIQSVAQLWGAGVTRARGMISLPMPPSEASKHHYTTVKAPIRSQSEQRAENLRLIIQCWVYLNITPQLQTARLFHKDWSSCSCNLSSKVNVNWRAFF